MENENSNKKSKFFWTTINRIVAITTLFGIAFAVYEYFEHKKIDQIDNRPLLIPEQELKISNVRLRHFSNALEVFDHSFTTENLPQNIGYKIGEKYFFTENKKLRNTKPSISIISEYTVDIDLEIKNKGKRKAIYQAFLVSDGDSPPDSMRSSYLNKEKRGKSVKEMGSLNFDLNSGIGFHEMHPNDSFTAFVKNHTLRVESFGKNGNISIRGILIYKDELNNYYDTFITTIFNLDSYKVQVLPIYQTNDSIYFKLIDIEYTPQIPPIHKIFRFVNYSYNTEYIYTNTEKYLLKSLFEKK